MRYRCVCAGLMAAAALWGGCAGGGAAQAKGGNGRKPSYEELVKEAKVLPGFLKIHRKKDAVYCEIPSADLGKPFFFKAALERAAGEKGLVSGSPLWRDQIASFVRVDDERLQLVFRNVSNVARADSPLASAVRNGFSDSVAATLKVEAKHPTTGDLLVNLQPLLLSDIAGLARAMNPDGREALFSLDAGGSYIEWLKVFPENLEVQALLHFAAKKAGHFDSVPDARSVPLGVRYSFSRIPETGYRPRLADDRVGYFTVPVRDFSRNDPMTSERHYIRRWHLEKADPKAERSAPKRPIRFWIENTTPREYRDAVRKGILAWNKAFEPLGYVNAIEAPEQPDDAEWDPADVRYSVVRWFVARESGFAGLGRSRIHPGTGEILDADILIAGEAVRRIRNRYRLGVAPLREGRAEEAEGAGIWDCRLPFRAAAESGFAADVLTARGELPADAEAPKELIDSYITNVVAHEVGHTLGLRHNFRASLLAPLEKLHDREWLKDHALCGSVMDYDPPNIAPRGMEQGPYFQEAVGPYDIWAVSYGYAPVEAASPEAETTSLDAIARRCAEPLHDYATDEDADDADPFAARHDFSADPLGFSLRRLRNAREVVESLDHFLKPGAAHDDFRPLVESLFATYGHVAAGACRFVGGRTFRRSHVGDPNAGPPLSPVPPDETRRALSLLREEIFSDRPFTLPPRLPPLLAPGRLWGGENDGFWDQDFFLLPRISTLRKEALNRLLSPDTLRRVQEASSGAAAVTLPELFRWTEETVWTELDGKGAEISPARREAQGAHAEKLIAIGCATGGSGGDHPEEARALAWAQLRRLSERLGKRLAAPGPLGEATKAHLERTRARIDGALSAFARGE